jgi:hypothetical protein
MPLLDDDPAVDRFERPPGEDGPLDLLHVVASEARLHVSRGACKLR